MTTVPKNMPKNGSQIGSQMSFHEWLDILYSADNFSLEPLTGDAGFRCYYRLNFTDSSLIAVNAPPDKSNNLGFLAISDELAKHDVKVPKVIHHQPELGYFVLSDLGSCLLSDKLTTDSAKAYYQQAIDCLMKINAVEQVPSYALPIYDQTFVELELDIFNQWLLDKHLAFTLSTDEKSALKEAYQVLVDNALSQPQCFMHRDYHSRNLMLVDEEIAVIDFQDAVKGPITYDIVSLLRDCYVKWPAALVDNLLEYFIVHAAKKFNLAENKATWQRWFDLMGVQRHIKASGIFARLHHRDGKSGYLKDIPLTLSYLTDICANYPELHIIAEIVSNKVLPALAKANGAKS